MIRTFIYIVALLAFSNTSNACSTLMKVSDGFENNLPANNYQEGTLNSSEITDVFLDNLFELIACDVVEDNDDSAGGSFSLKADRLKIAVTHSSVFCHFYHTEIPGDRYILSPGLPVFILFRVLRL